MKHKRSEWITCILALAAWTALTLPCPVAAVADEETTGIARQFEERVKPFFAKHCNSCHTGVDPKGSLRLDTLTAVIADEKSRNLWTHLVDRVKHREMPPKDQPRPAPADVEALSEWVLRSARSVELKQRAHHGRVVLRRLNRIEYENTIRDLLGVTVAIKEQLPADGSANGFDNAAAAHHTSAFLMEKYLEAAETALNHAISNRPKGPLFATKRYSLADTHQVKRTTERVFRQTDAAVVCFASSLWQSVGITPFYPQEGGLYRFRISASAFQSPDKPVTYRVVSGNSRLTGKAGLVGYFDAPPDKPAVVEFVQYIEPRTTISILPWGLASAQAVSKIGADMYDGPGLAVQFVDVEGPLVEEWPPTSHRRIFGDLAFKAAPLYNQSTRVEVTSTDPMKDAEQTLKNFTRRAFRRAVTDVDVQPFLDVVAAKLKESYSFEQAVRAALKGVLVSPEFLFLNERPGPLDDFALANRLSYFLWSTMPDDTLFDLAERKKLREPGVLREQVERMLQHPRAVALTENFLGQWLGLRDIDFTEPSHILYPEFDHMLKVSMIRETELFFEELLKNDLSLTNFVSSDFTMLNKRLAKHYGLPGPEGWEFKKTALPEGSVRGGVLTMASVLKVTANGTSTSPVMRGAWVLDRILGTPPSPPPDDVAGLDPDIRGATTIREQLAKHRTIASCASCHVKIDPPGFALESFDCIGGFRERYRVTGAGESVVVEGRRMAYHIGKKVDPSDEMSDGAKFANVVEFKKLLLRDPDQLARSLTTKLITYGTGAAPSPIDREEIDEIVRRVKSKNCGLRTLVHEVVQTPLFLNK